MCRAILLASLIEAAVRLQFCPELAECGSSSCELFFSNLGFKIHGPCSTTSAMPAPAHPARRAKCLCPHISSAQCSAPAAPTLPLQDMSAAQDSAPAPPVLPSTPHPPRPAPAGGSLRRPSQSPAHPPLHLRWIFFPMTHGSPAAWSLGITKPRGRSRSHGWSCFSR